MSNETEVIDDLIVLGNAVPDEISGGRKSICTAGYSPSRDSLIRLYPVPTNVHPDRWTIFQVPVERNKQDVRSESWKIKGSHDEWDNLYKKLRYVGELKNKERKNLLAKLIAKFGVDCVKVLNENKESLGFITPKSMKPYFEDRKTLDKTVQIRLDSDLPYKTIHNYDKQPRMEYVCSNCQAKNPHDQQIIEWGVYEWMRKNPNDHEKVWENLHITDPEYDQWFLVGNQARYLTAFMIISLYRFKRKP